MKSECLIYDVPFKGLLEPVEQSGEDMFVRVGAVIYDQPYSSCQMGGVG